MKLLTITFYKLKMMLSDRLFFSAMIIIPLIITVATGYALRYEKMGVIPLAFVDEDKSQYSGLLVERLSGKEGLRLLRLDRAEAMRQLKENGVEAVFIIKSGFQEKIIQGDDKEIIDLLKSPSSYSADYAAEITAGEVLRFITGNMAADWVSKRYAQLGKQADKNLREQVIRHVDAQWEPLPLMTVNYEELQGRRAEKPAGASIPAATATSVGIIVVFIMLYVLFSCGWLIEERINGTLKRLVSGPGALGYSFAGSLCALMLSGMLQIALFSAVDLLAFGVNLFPGALSYIVFFAYLAAVISISMLLSSVLKSPAQLQAAAPVAALLTGFAGGCFWNFSSVPPRLARLALFTPQGWALLGINGLLVNPASLEAILLPVGVMLGIALLLLPLSYYLVSSQTRI